MPCSVSCNSLVSVPLVPVSYKVDCFQSEKGNRALSHIHLHRLNVLLVLVDKVLECRCPLACSLPVCSGCTVDVNSSSPFQKTMLQGVSLHHPLFPSCLLDPDPMNGKFSQPIFHLTALNVQWLEKHCLNVNELVRTMHIEASLVYIPFLVIIL